MPDVRMNYISGTCSYPGGATAEQRARRAKVKRAPKDAPRKLGYMVSYMNGLPHAKQRHMG